MITFRDSTTPLIEICSSLEYSPSAKFKNNTQWKGRNRAPGRLPSVYVQLDSLALRTGILTDENYVDVPMTGFDPWLRGNVHDVGEKAQPETQLNVPGFAVRIIVTGFDVAFYSDSVSFHRRYGLFQEVHVVS